MSYDTKYFDDVFVYVNEQNIFNYYKKTKIIVFVGI
jgi:hypothetical protein